MLERQAHSVPDRQAAPLPGDVRAAIALMRARLDAPLPVSEIARHCGVAARTLSQHFRSFVGMSPGAYHRHLRLAAVREALRAADAGGSISDIAHRHGFAHAGRFSRQYREQFGESPSATLRRARTAGREMPGPAVSARGRPAIAVLPLAAPAHEPALAWLGEATAERLAAALGAEPSVAVLVRSARAAWRDPRRIARETGARYVLAGRLVRQDIRLRAVLHLTDAATGAHVWGDSLDGRADQPLRLQDAIVAAARRAIGPRVQGAEIARAMRTPVRDLDAHGLTLRALPCLYASTPDAARRALEALDRAMEADPGHGLAAALAAWGHAQLVMYSGTPQPGAARQEARRLAGLAAILDDGDPIALTARSAVHTMAGEFDTAEALVARALARDPASGWAWGRSGWLSAYRGDSDRAIRHFRRALALGPETARANMFTGIGGAHFDAGRYDAAVRWVTRAITDRPDLAWANRSLSVSYARLGETGRARESLQALRRFAPGITVGNVVTAVPYRRDFLERLANGLSDLGLPA